jgi:hypothetical protein
MNIFKKLKKLNFPSGEYVVVGSGPLAARGIREARDLDIAVSKKLLKEIINSEKYKKKEKFGKLFLLDETDEIDIITRLDWSAYKTTVEEAIKSADIINGFPFLNISETIKFKQALNRKKDLNDIKNLKNYIKNI